MQSNLSNSTVSKPDWRDPSSILLPIFIGGMRAAPYAAFSAMFLGEDFGLSGGLPAPSAWPLAAICAIAFWAARYLPKVLRNATVFNIALVLLGILCWIVWMWLEPHWDIGLILRDPIALANEHGQFAWTFIIAMVFWFITLRIALDEREQSSEAVRGMMVRSLIGVLAGVILAGLVGGDKGDDGLQAAFVALPVALVAGVGAVGMSEMASTRATARRRGTSVPGWSRWARSFAGTATILVVVTFVAALIFGPGFIDIVLDVMRTVWQAIAQVILWILTAIVYVFVYIYRGIAWLFAQFFDTELPPMEVPEMGEQGTPPPVMEREEGDTDPLWFAPYLRFGAIALLVIVGLALLTRFARFRSKDSDTDVDEERTSVFSGKQLRDQLRNLFRRGQGAEKPRKLNLADDPPTVRDSMLYLQVLAERLGTPRRPAETPHDFTARLRGEWTSLYEPLAEINHRYERARYGETEEDRNAVVTAWRQIWAAKQQEPNSGA